MEGGRLIGEGTYGCVHKPSLKCANEKKIKTYQNKISKIFGFSYIKDTGIWSKLKSICLDALQSNELAIEVLDLFESSFLYAHTLFAK